MATETLTERSTSVAGLIAHSWGRYQQDRARPILPARFHPDPKLWSDRGLFAAWLGHSTVLLKIDGAMILTDPVLGDRIGLNLGPMTVGLKRMVALPLPQARIPTPDIVLLSHAHMDHFDIPSLRALESGRTRVVTAAKTSDLLRAPGYQGVDELAWGEEIRIGEVTIRAVEVRHWGARMHSDTFRGYNGYLIETPSYRVLFGGDTALTDSFRRLRDTRAIDLAIMPIGSYEPWIRAHCNPEQALQMANDAGAKFVLPIHHQTFQLGYEPYGEPIERLRLALGNDSHRLVTTQIGQEFRLSS